MTPIGLRRATLPTEPATYCPSVPRPDHSSPREEGDAVHLLDGGIQRYTWGSPTAIPAFMGLDPDTEPVAEVWYGAHPYGPTRLATSNPDDSRLHSTLETLVADNPLDHLGARVVETFGPNLPYLVKLIAPDRPLSLQVHPDRQRARQRFEQERSEGMALDDRRRNYKDQNHKPELVVALTTFSALVGFRTPMQILQRLDGLDTRLTNHMKDMLKRNADQHGIRETLAMLFAPSTQPSPTEILEIADAINNRLHGRQDLSESHFIQLNQLFPGDPATVASLLMNPVQLKPGEALYVRPGCFHAYLEGLAMEVMASSDNVVRAGLTSKHVDTLEALAIADYTPGHIDILQPEVSDEHTEHYRPPISDFNIAIAAIETRSTEPLNFMEQGPRIALCLSGQVAMQTKLSRVTLRQGQAAFISDHEGAVFACGSGKVALTTSPSAAPSRTSDN